MTAAQAGPDVVAQEVSLVGKGGEIHRSFVKTWLERAGEHTESSPAGHVSAMITAAVRDGALRVVDGQTSDGFHTFDELYRHRLLLNAALFNAWGRGRARGYATGPEYDVHRSLLHHDGEAPFGGGWFIVVAALPTGQVSWHYPVEHWDLFRQVPETHRAAVWDGHTADQAADRLQRFLEEGPL